MPVRPWLPVVLAICAAACTERVTLVVMVPAPLHESADPGSKEVGQLRPGQRVESRSRRPWEDELWWKVEQGGTVGYVHQDRVARLPLSGDPRFVLAASTFRVNSLGPGAQALERYQIGAELRVNTALPGLGDRWAAVVRDGDLIGFAPRKDLALRPPKTSELLDAALGALRGLDLPKAAEVAEQLAAAAPSDSDAQDFAAELLAEAQPSRSAAYRRNVRSPRGPLPQLPATAPATSGQTAFVAATSLNLRAGRSRDARLVAKLKIGTPLVLLESKDGWARIRIPGATPALTQIDLGKLESLAARSEPALSRDGVITASDPEGPGSVALARGNAALARGTAAEGVEGYARLEFLDVAQPQLDELQAQWAKARERGELETALAYQARAWALASEDRTAGNRLLETAIEAHRYSYAAVVARAMSALPLAAVPAADGDGLRVRVSLLEACRGDPYQADRGTIRSYAWQRGDAAPVPADFTFGDALPKNACLEDVSLVGPCLQEEQDAQLRKQSEAHAAWRKELETLFSGAARMTIELENRRTGALTPALPLFVYSYRIRTDGFCDSVQSAAKEDVQVYPVPRPTLWGRETLRLWVDPGDTERRAYGALFAKSAEEAREVVKDRLAVANGAYREVPGEREKAQSAPAHWEAFRLPPACFGCGL